MDADLDLLLIAALCTVDDLLPYRAANTKRRITNREVITLCIAQACSIADPTSGFWRSPRAPLVHVFPGLPERSAFTSAGCGCRRSSRR